MTQGLVALVESKTAITDVIGSRFYPRMLPQGLNTFPAATFRTVDISGRPSFDGASTYDFNNIDIHCYGRTYSEASQLFELMRKELEDSEGIFGGIEITYVRFTESGAEDYLEELELHTKQLELAIGTPRKP